MKYTVRLWITVDADSAFEARQHVVDQCHNTDWVPSEWECLIDDEKEILDVE